MAEELGRLALEPGENFCMGGPGMIFSREVLRRMVPHISTCLREMYTTHEDVEVGRCVRRFGGTQCVWSYEVRTETVCFLFFQVPMSNNVSRISWSLYSLTVGELGQLCGNSDINYGKLFRYITVDNIISYLRFSALM